MTGQDEWRLDTGYVIYIEYFYVQYLLFMTQLRSLEINLRIIGNVKVKFPGVEIG